MINRFDIEQPQLTFDGDKCSIHHKISTLILNHQEFMEGKLTAAIIEAARQAGVNEIYLIDRDEVKKAIVEYMQRKNSITAEKNYEVKDMAPGNGGGVMATCKDCVHADMCRFYTEELAKAKGITLGKDIFEYFSSGDVCEGFKDRSQFVELPVKPGEKVFYFDTAGRIYESTVTQMVYGATGFLIDSDVMFNSNLIGERFFLTREAAEQALKEREG